VFGGGDARGFGTWSVTATRGRRCQSVPVGVPADGLSLKPSRLTVDPPRRRYHIRYFRRCAYVREPRLPYNGRAGTDQQRFGALSIGTRSRATADTPPPPPLPPHGRRRPDTAPEADPTHPPHTGCFQPASACAVRRRRSGGRRSKSCTANRDTELRSVEPRAVRSLGATRHRQYIGNFPPTDVTQTSDSSRGYECNGTRTTGRRPRPAPPRYVDATER